MAEEAKNDAAAADKKAAKKAPKAEQTVGKFTNGDHMVHLLFQKGKKFISQHEDDRTLNLIIEVKVGPQAQFSALKSDVLVNDDGMISWDEHLFFELKNLSPQKAKETMIHIRVLNQGWLKNELVGLAQYDLSSIYFKQDHKIEHMWIGLENPDAEDFENMKGLLKISANVQGPKDNAQRLESHVGPEPDKMNMFMSPSIKRTFHQLTISIIEGQDLTEYGGFMTSASLECYFKVQYGGGNPLKTTVCNQINKKVQVMQQFLLPVQTPVLNDRLVIEAWDYNSVASDSQLGSLILSAKKLIAEGAKEGGVFIWKNIYGSPAENVGDIADAMDRNPDIASQWKGQVLIHVKAEENDKPKKGVEKVGQEQKKSAEDEENKAPPPVNWKVEAQKAQYFDKEDYEIMIEIGQGVTMPEPDTEYKVKVVVEKNEWTTEVPKEKKGEYVRWSDRCKEVQRWKLSKNTNSVFTTKDEDLTMRNEFRIYVYLIDTDEHPVCFWHGLLSEFMDLNAQWRWLQMKPDKTYNDDLQDHQAGMISVKISVARLAQHGGGSIPFQNELAWSKSPPRRTGAFNLRCFIFQCRDLPAADSDGSSDPFIKIFNTSGEDVTTSVIEDNVNPIFMECKEVGIDFLDRREFKDAPPVILDVMDADEGVFSNSADFLGRCTIPLKDLHDKGHLKIGASNDINKPEWYPIKFGTDPGSPACGEILISFQLLTDDDQDAIPVEAVPRKMDNMVDKLDYDVFINCLGLRELESIGLIPIQKAFVSFMVKSLTDPKLAGTLQNIKTTPGEPGPSPNINSTIKFNIPLPKDQLYCPALSCIVYDQVFMGFSQPQVGTFTLPLGRLMAERNEEKRVMIVTARALVERLRARLAGRVYEGDIDISVDGQGNNANKEHGAQVLTTDGISAMEEIQDENDLKAKAAADKQNQLIEEEEEKEGLLAADGQKEKPKSKVPAKKPNPTEMRDKAKKAQEEKTAAKEERRRQNEEMMATMDSSNNVSLPNYDYDEQLRVYREVLPPKPEIFRSVGFNDQTLIKEIMALQNKIPQEAAMSEQVSKQNTMLARKIRKHLKQKVKNDAAAIDKSKKSDDLTKSLKREDAKAESDQIQIAIDLMAKIYEKTNKHYRVYFEDELEHNKEIFDKDIFYTADIMRGQTRGVEKGWFDFGAGNQDESGQESTLRVVGRFKGTIDLINKEENKEFEEEKQKLIDEIFSSLNELYKQKTGTSQEFSLECIENNTEKQNFISECNKMELKCVPSMVKFLEDVCFQSMIKEMLNRQTDAIVHLYLIKGYDFASRDIGSPSDPYLIVRCGEMEFNDQDNYQNDESNPKFNKRLDFNVSFPGAPPLQIEAYDYDLLFGDDLIGKTSIDLDDRFFNPKWQAIEEKPIETRELYHMSSAMNQGTLDMWVDIDPATKTSDCGKVWEIQSEPDRDFEVRLAVFGCSGVPMEDWEGTSDVYIKAFISDKDQQETDTHYRNTNGKPSFNYRLLFDVKTPSPQPFKLTLQAWDRDLLKSNDLICQWTVDISHVIRDSKITKGPINLAKDYYEQSMKKRMNLKDGEEPFYFDKKDPSKFYLTSYSPADPNKKKPIKIALDLRCVPVEYALQNKVGAARGDPNIEPNLPPPIGRFELSLNPIKMLNQMCGAALRCKIWCCICCLCCLMVIYFVFPLLASFKTLLS